MDLTRCGLLMEGNSVMAYSDIRFGRTRAAGQGYEIEKYPWGKIVPSEQYSTNHISGPIVTTQTNLIMSKRQT
jgi:hypothetical protein